MSEETATNSGPSNAGALASGYRVLARKYRPQTFAELIGQDAVVRTLTNAITHDRLAHAWLLTGVRGVGKTTTARIIARALNCTAGDGPTPEPCGVCDNCVAIAADRHPDVLEMDAASRTGVDDIRELIDGVRYRPQAAPYKVYIIDEVHMLSTNAFNALLKTLEEPPEHVKFIFATTEVRKVPVTVLSRCQRFDLRRVAEDELATHFRTVAEAEGAVLDPGALQLIARAADGSVRDGLSILDQAVASFEADGGPITEDAVRAMLGLADRTQVFELMEAVLGGNTAAALDRMAESHAAGADAESVINDLLELTHWLTRVKITPEVADDPMVPEAERVTGRRMAETLTMAVLARAWQMLLKGLGEVQAAPQPGKAAEMVLVRLAYAAKLPPPAELVAKLEKEGSVPQSQPQSAPAPAPAPNPAPGAETQSSPTGAGTARGEAISAAAATAPQPTPPEPAAETRADAAVALPETFLQLVEFLDEKREGRVAAELRTQAHLVRYELGRIEIRPAEGAEASLAQRLGTVLQHLTGERWAVTLSSEEGEPTLAQQAASHAEAQKREAAEHPLVKATLEVFPGAEIVEVRDRATGEPDAPGSDGDMDGEIDGDGDGAERADDDEEL